MDTPFNLSCTPHSLQCFALVLPSVIIGLRTLPNTPPDVRGLYHSDNQFLGSEWSSTNLKTKPPSHQVCTCTCIKLRIDELFSHFTKPRIPSLRCSGGQSWSGGRRRVIESQRPTQTTLLRTRPMLLIFALG